VRNVAYGESDVIVTLLTPGHGKLGVLVRGGRKSTKRVGGALEPFHTISAWVDDKSDRGRDLGVLREARIARMRPGIVASLAAMEAAGTALRWARHVFPARHAEPEAWDIVVGLLDVLDAGAPPSASLAGAALRLLAAMGYGLDLAQCVKCGRACPEDKKAYLDAAHGGLVCRACGGAARVMSPELRALSRALQRGEAPPMTEAQAAEILGIIDEAMAAHAGYDDAGRRG
jgi:DNA repair protein RecO (recombination protein O)